MWRPVCLPFHWGLSYWETVAFPTSFLSSQEISVADFLRDPLCRKGVCPFQGCREVGGVLLQCLVVQGGCRLGGSEMHLPFVCL